MSSSKPDVLDWYARMLHQDLDDLQFSRSIYPARLGRYLLRILGGLDPMAGKGGRNGRAFDPVEFVTINLDGNAEKEFKKWAEVHLPTLTDDLANFIAEEHKVGLSWDQANACFIASATCKDEKSPNHNCCITARSDDWTEALLLVLFKALVIPSGKAWSDVSRPAAWG